MNFVKCLQNHLLQKFETCVRVVFIVLIRTEWRQFGKRFGGLVILYFEFMRKCFFFFNYRSVSPYLIFTQTQVHNISSCPYRTGGTRWRGWLRHCATSRKVAGSNPDGVTGIFQRRNPSGRTMALGSTQPLTEMSTRNISWGKGGRCVGLTTLPPSCGNCLEIWEP